MRPAADVNAADVYFPFRGNSICDGSLSPSSWLNIPSKRCCSRGRFFRAGGSCGTRRVEQAVSRGEIAADEHAVRLVTGSGFKDERSLVRMVGEEPTTLVGSFKEFATAVRAGLAS